MGSVSDPPVAVREGAGYICETIMYPKGGEPPFNQARALPLRFVIPTRLRGPENKAHVSIRLSGGSLSLHRSVISRFSKEWLTPPRGNTSP